MAAQSVHTPRLACGTAVLDVRLTRAAAPPLQARQPAQAGPGRLPVSSNAPQGLPQAPATAGVDAAAPPPSFPPGPLHIATAVHGGAGWQQPGTVVLDSPRKDPGFHLLRHYITPAVAAAAAAEFGPDLREAGRAIWALQ